MGGTKVLMALFDDSGVLVSSHKFPTDPNYAQFLADFKREFQSLNVPDITAAGIAIPGLVDHEKGVAVHFGNLAWVNIPIQADLEQILGCPIALENDAKAGALYQAHFVKDAFSEVLYIAIGTGIGVAYVSSGILDRSHGDDGGSAIMIKQPDGQTISWDHLTSGKAIVATFGKKASELTDPEAWKTIAHNLSLGLVQVLGMYRPQVIVFGGGVGAHLDKYKSYLQEELQRALPNGSTPEILMGDKPEESVLYGCLHLARNL